MDLRQIQRLLACWLWYSPHRICVGICGFVGHGPPLHLLLHGVPARSQAIGRSVAHRWGPYQPWLCGMVSTPSCSFSSKIRLTESSMRDFVISPFWTASFSTWMVSAVEAMEYVLQMISLPALTESRMIWSKE